MRVLASGRNALSDVVNYANPDAPPTRPRFARYLAGLRGPPAWPPSPARGSKSNFGALLARLVALIMATGRSKAPMPGSKASSVGSKARVRVCDRRDGGYDRRFPAYKELIAAHDRRSCASIDEFAAYEAALVATGAPGDASKREGDTLPVSGIGTRRAGTRSRACSTRTSERSTRRPIVCWRGDLRYSRSNEDHSRRDERCCRPYERYSRRDLDCARRSKRSCWCGSRRYRRHEGGAGDNRRRSTHRET